MRLAHLQSGALSPLLLQVCAGGLDARSGL